MTETVAVIPFRAGSKGLPGKNKRMIGGSQLWWWSAQAADDSELVERILITSDYEPHPVATVIGAHWIDRPPELATDTAPLDAAIIHALEGAQVADDAVVVILQPTIPIRREGLVDDCIRAFLRFPLAKSLVTANRLHYVWHGDSGQLLNGPRLNRQDMDSSQIYYEEDGSVFIVRAGDLREHRSRVVAPVTLYETPRTVDVDDEEDFRLAEALMRVKGARCSQQRKN